MFITACLGVAALAWARPEDAVSRLASADARDRQAAEQELIDAGMDARPALEAAEEDPSPAVRQAAAILLLRLDAGVNEMPLPLVDTLGPLAVQAVTGNIQAQSQLLRWPAASSPALARVVQNGLVTDDRRLGAAAAVLLQRSRDFFRLAHGRTAISQVDRTAFVGAMARLDPSGSLVIRWLEAALEREHVQHGNERTDAIKRALAASDKASDLWRWIDGDIDAPTPPDLAFMSPDDQAITEAARAILFGREPTNRPADELADAAVGRAVALVADDEAKLLQATDRLAAVGTRMSSPQALALAGKPDEALRFAAIHDPVDHLGLQWLTGDLAAVSDFGAAAGVGNRQDPEAVQQARYRLVQMLRQAHGRSREPVEPFHTQIADAASAALAGESVVQDIKVLRRNDPTQAGWSAVEADLTDNAALAKVAWLMPLDDAVARLDAADLRLAFAEDAVTRAAAIDDVIDAVLFHLITPPDENRDYPTGAMLYEVRRAMRLAEEAGDDETALRLSAVVALLPFRSDVYKAMSHEGILWAPARPASNVLGSVAEVHRYRLRRAQRDGNDAAAQREYKLAYDLAPMDVAATIDRVRHLDATDRRDEAGTVFNEAFARVQERVVQYGQSATMHNQASWLAARVGRRPDLARSYAATATALLPHSPAYLDTLAEAFAADGQRPQMEQTMREVLLISRDAELPLYIRRLREMRQSLDERAK